MGSQNPTEPLAGTLIATTISTISAVFITRWLSRRAKYQVLPESLQPENGNTTLATEGANHG